VSYTAGQPYVGATLEMYPAGKVLGDGTNNTGNFIAWDAKAGKIVWSNKEQFSAWGGATSTDSGVTFYGTLEGYLKAVDSKTGKELYKFKTPSGIIGNINTFEHGGKQYVAVLSGVGGWAGIGLAGGLLAPDNAAKWHTAVDQGREQGDEAKVVGTAGLGAVGGYAALADYTTLGGQLTVFGLPD
jgi:glucose dehydrogenase